MTDVGSDDQSKKKGHQNWYVGIDHRSLPLGCLFVDSDYVADCDYDVDHWIKQHPRNLHDDDGD